MPKKPKTTGKEFRKRSAAAKKGWRTRKAKTPEFQKRSVASKKGWITRDVNKIKSQYGEFEEDFSVLANTDLTRNERLKIMEDTVQGNWLAENGDSLSKAKEIIEDYYDRNYGYPFTKDVLDYFNENVSDREILQAYNKDEKSLLDLVEDWGKKYDHMEELAAQRDVRQEDESVYREPDYEPDYEEDIVYDNFVDKLLNDIAGAVERRKYMKSKANDLALELMDTIQGAINEHGKNAVERRLNGMRNELEDYVDDLNDSYSPNEGSLASVNYQAMMKLGVDTFWGMNLSEDILKEEGFDVGEYNELFEEWEE